MPSRSLVEAFVAQVVGGDHVGAIRDWYRDDAWMQENQAPPREGGREALMSREAAFLAACEQVHTELVGGPAIEGDTVAIRWRFTFRLKDGSTLRQEEVAWQTWRGDKIATETFFYDPGQNTRSGSSNAATGDTDR
ncbi:MAG TPA: nuclear transport factor 2 family protein [Caulobacteraceae bacterium]|nr:nuclear transport factor 2 family protein [Caulobacteraceae bacterium]